MHRPGSARPIAVATWVTAALMAGGQLLAGPYDEAATYAVLAGIVFIAALAWATMWRPAVEIAPHGVVLRNPVRTVLVTWPAIEEVDGRFGLRLRTADRRWSAWAASAPPGRDRLRGVPSDVAVAVEARLAQMRTRGHLDTGAVEGDGAEVTADRAALTALGVTTGALVVGVALTALG